MKEPATTHPHPSFWDFINRLDYALFRIESVLAVVAFAVMAIMVFLAVLWRLLPAAAATWLLPHGFIFSQRVALSLMLWLVMLGSSMAAYKQQHIVLQAALKLIPAPLQRLHHRISLLTAAVFTLFLAFVSGRYMLNNLHTWINSQHYAGVFESIAIPYWAVTLAMPLGFGLTALRFIKQAIMP